MVAKREEKKPEQTSTKGQAEVPQQFCKTLDFCTSLLKAETAECILVL
jgi:hypothetical protein